MTNELREAAMFAKSLRAMSNGPTLGMSMSDSAILQNASDFLEKIASSAATNEAAGRDDDKFPHCHVCDSEAFPFCARRDCPPISSLKKVTHPAPAVDRGLSEAEILEEVEQRLHHWRCPIGNEDGDHLSLYDLIGSDHMESKPIADQLAWALSEIARLRAILAASSTTAGERE